MPRLSWILSACTLSGALACGSPELLWDYPADNPRIQYTGRVAFQGESAVFSYPGVSIRARFEGSRVEVSLKDGGRGGPRGTNYFYAIVDEDAPVKLEVRADTLVYEIASGLDSGEHTLELVKLTESDVGTTELLGLQVRGELIAPPPRPGRHIEVIGDAFTCGYGNEAVLLPPPYGDPNSGFTSANQNFYRTFGAFTARNLEASVSAVCVSGRGLTRNSPGVTAETMPNLYGRVLPQRVDPRWDFSGPIPDVVVINLGFADFAQGVPDATLFQDTYKAFVRMLRQRYPQARIVCTVGSVMSDYYPPGAQHWTRIQAYVSQVVADLQAEGDSQVHYLAFSIQRPPYGEDWHPTIANHQVTASELTRFLRSITGW
jgi:lysophospholipase L1-like esterase